jgi:hypothetical protein
MDSSGLQVAACLIFSLACATFTGILIILGKYQKVYVLIQVGFKLQRQYLKCLHNALSGADGSHIPGAGAK